MNYSNSNINSVTPNDFDVSRAFILEIHSNIRHVNKKFFFFSRSYKRFLHKDCLQKQSKRSYNELFWEKAFLKTSENYTWKIHDRVLPITFFKKGIHRRYFLGSSITKCRSSPSVFCKKHVLKNLAKLTEKHLHQGLISIKLQISRL